jgi:hypothetical protein
MTDKYPGQREGTRQERKGGRTKERRKMIQESNKRKICAGFPVWLRAKDRTESKKIEFGKWWRLGTSYWRVAWIEATNELYAVELGETGRYVLLTRLDKKEVNEFMKKWFDGDNLEALFHRFGIATT